MRVVDLFSGLGGWSAAFAQRGHEVVTVDLDPEFKPSIVADVATLPTSDLPWQPDIVLASPPCECFSVAAIGHHWHDEGYGSVEPKTPEAAQALALVEATMRFIGEVQPRAWIVENPVGKMRKLPVMRPYERRTVTFCQYGEARMKPTDLWGGFPTTLRLKPRCANGDPCHERAPAGTKTTGTQGIKDRAARALIPPALSLAVCLAMEAGPGQGSGVRTLAEWTELRFLDNRGVANKWAPGAYPDARRKWFPPRGARQAWPIHRPLGLGSSGPPEGAVQSVLMG